MCKSLLKPGAVGTECVDKSEGESPKFSTFLTSPRVFHNFLMVFHSFPSGFPQRFLVRLEPSHHPDFRPFELLG